MVDIMISQEIKRLLDLPLAELIAQADKVRRQYIGKRLDVCTILNAKSGLCSEDCKFCAQSSHHHTGVDIYALKSVDEMVAAAKKAKEIGSMRFGIVTSGNSLSQGDLEIVIQAAKRIIQEVGIVVCASLGSLTLEQLKLLKSAGVSRYHHNIETSASFYPKIVSTHTFEERIRTVKFAKKCGFEVCSGGIIGLGETMQNRIEMALCLKELNVDSVPINILVPVKGTKLEGLNAITCTEAIRTIAIFRIILQDKVIKVAAGRESVLKDFQAMAFMAGANGMLIGGYLTTRGREVSEDKKLVSEIEKLWQI